MYCSKPLPAFTFDLLCYLNRDHLERFTIICCPLKNFSNRYFRSMPYRVFDELRILGGSYVLRQNFAYLCTNRNNVQQFLAGQPCNDGFIYYSFIEMLPYLCPTVRIKEMTIAIDSTYTPEQMESIAYLWRDGNISIPSYDDSRIFDFQMILNSPIILQCRILKMTCANFPLKDYKVLYTVKVISVYYREDDVDFNYWQQFLEQSEIKPVVVFPLLRHESIINLLDLFSKAFSSAVSPNAFKIAFVNHHEPLTEFRVTNSTSGEVLELKKGFPMEYQPEHLMEYDRFTLFFLIALSLLRFA